MESQRDSKGCSPEPNVPKSETENTQLDRRSRQCELFQYYKAMIEIITQMQSLMARIVEKFEDHLR
ncbi:pAG2 protein [Xiburema virus]|uniref:PAG2 protein n=1 Tax=Xiburema virus TaxID=1272959 RepID=A0A059TZZ7_9RHAB|nr:pAG2 protein [Xiburema virus]AHZ45723.1 pAG2 protein [Xiburema virus]